MTRRDITSEMDSAAAEESGTDHVLVIHGEEFTLPGGSLSWNVQVEIARFAKEQSSPLQLEQAGSMVALDDAMKIAFGPDQYHRIKQLMRSSAEFMVLVNAVTSLYTGQAAGESGGSSGGSSNTSELPKPTSNGSTASTSDEPVSEKSG